MPLCTPIKMCIPIHLRQDFSPIIFWHYKMCFTAVFLTACMWSVWQRPWSSRWSLTLIWTIHVITYKVLSPILDKRQILPQNPFRFHQCLVTVKTNVQKLTKFYWIIIQCSTRILGCKLSRPLAFEWFKLFSKLN